MEFSTSRVTSCLWMLPGGASRYKGRMRRRLLSAGTTVGGYRVEGLLREDPGVRTYAATDVERSRPVTLRVISVADAEDASLLGRYAAGYAEILESISHPNVASVYEVGRYGRDVFIARERVPAPDLRSLLEHRGPLPTDAALEIFEQTASALTELRRHGLTGGDLTPRNVLVDSAVTHPHVHLVDFGLGAADLRLRARPEGARRGDRPEPSDVYALGGLLRDAVAGVSAQTQSPAERRRLPGALDRVIGRALSEDPGERYATLSGLRRAVRRAADPHIDEPLRRAFSVPDPEGAAGDDSAEPLEPLESEPLEPAMAGNGGGGGDGGPPDETGGGGDPPRSAFALLYARESVLAGEPFELEIGLSPVPDRRLAGDEELERPADSHGPYTLAIHVLAPDFRLQRGESWRNELRVTAKRPYPRLVLHLTAKSVRARWKARVIQATYSTGGQTMGLAVRPIGVARATELVPKAKPTQRPRTSAMPTDSAWPAPDLTINILRTDLEHPDSLEWAFESPHDIDLSSAQPSPLGTKPEDFAKLVYEGIPSRKGNRAYRFVVGAGRRVTEKVPACLWSLLEAVAKQVDGPPTILINSADPYMPWELAVLERPLDDSLPPFLGAQAVIARWVIGTTRPPPEPPYPNYPAKEMSIISGVYDSAELPALKAAEEEAEELSSEYGARPVKALLDPVMECLCSRPVSDLVHFAMHARWRVGGYRNGLVMADGEILEATELEGIDLDPPPFVFLNACQAGASDELLGDYAGLAAAFLRVGAAGVIAPLWAVDDKIAKDVATRFYRGVFGTGTVIAEYLRGERSTFRSGTADLSTTRLAYVFYGHPAMTLRAERAPAAGG